MAARLLRRLSGPLRIAESRPELLPLAERVRTAELAADSLLFLTEEGRSYVELTETGNAKPHYPQYLGPVG